MSRTTTFIMVMSGVTLLFYFTGLFGDGFTNPLLTLLFEPENMTTLAFFSTVLVAIGTSAAAIFIGYYTKNVELAAMTVFVPYMITLLWSFIDVYNKLAASNKVVAVLIFGPLLLMFIITMVDWWRGKD